MKRVILDTNVYEFILKEFDRDTVWKLSRKKIMLIYGSDIIRKELRDIPKVSFYSVGSRTRNLRSALTSLYDILVAKSYTPDKKIKELAEKYFISYTSHGGRRKREELLNDFLIVSTATVKDLDIVVSEDRRTMADEFSLKSYRLVNAIEKKRTPKFIGFGEFRQIVRSALL